ncbi:hypothetical protein GP486_005727 [Trichoglossum hirsutum]|uniref:Zn(2)-C6 fungal-type domain-containing protein n=1 Tax=Trichoglossum hirsutum TaxID=265104 RepID=A0A9P8L8Q1_9PEZI|nr:hypothetical protein GP486_005727 [Trichoglossum hirsutum]
MSSSSSYQDAGDNYFNDLSKDRADGADGRDVDESRKRGSSAGLDGVDLPRPKRIACVVCRKRKLRCDGNKPSCGKCTRLGHRCAYDEVRKKSGPKRGYVKALEARLLQVETLLKTQDPQDSNGPNLMQQDRPGILLQPDFPTPPSLNIGIANRDGLGSIYQAQERYDTGTMQPPSLSIDPALGGDVPLTWEMIGLGLDEPLPPQDAIDELHQIYFDKCHPSIPMIHRARYLAAMSLTPHARPPVSLRYAIWTLAASVEEKYFNLQSHFYQRARKYLEETEMKGHGESMISVAHAQTWILIATYEFKLMYFPRAWMSTGRAIRLAQMMGLHRLDGTGLDVKQCLPPPRDWTEKEERRRTFWLAFCIDRYASIGTGWPMTIEEKDIVTMLPSSEEAYSKSKPCTAMPLNAALSPQGAATLPPFAGVILMACLFGRNLIHLHRPDADDRDDDLNGGFWTRHRTMDNILTNTALSLPNHLKLPEGIEDPNIVFSNMNIHTSTICLHQAAIFKAEKNNLTAVSDDSRIRCITAALEIAKIMKMICHMDLSRYLKSRPEDDQGKSSLQFLLRAMEALKRKNPLTSSFLVQLDVDIQNCGLERRPSDNLFGSESEEPNTRINIGQSQCSFGNLYQQPPPEQPSHAQQTSAQESYHSPGGSGGILDTGTYFPPTENLINLVNRGKPPGDTGVQDGMHGIPSPTATMDTSPDSGLPRGSRSTSNQDTPNSGFTPPLESVYYQHDFITGLATGHQFIPPHHPEKGPDPFGIAQDFLGGDEATSGELPIYWSTPGQ